MMSGGKDKKQKLRTVKEIDIPHSSSPPKHEYEERIEIYLKNHIIPLLHDNEKRLKEIDRKYSKLLKLLVTYTRK